MESVKSVSSLVVFLFLSFSLFAHEIPNYSIKERVEKADLVFEGEVVKVESFFLGKSRAIYTRNYVVISKSFKGRWTTDTIVVYTKGGLVDDHLSLHSHDAALVEGNRGIFICSETNYKKLRRNDIEGYTLLYETAGYIPYTGNMVGIKAYDNKIGYTEISVLYDSMQVATRLPIMYSHDQSRFTDTDCGSLDEISAALISFGNLQLTTDAQGTHMEFDVMCSANPNGLKFGKADIKVAYPTDVFGSNLVQGGVVQITKGQIILDDVYSLTYSDVSSNTININIDESGLTGDFYPMTVSNEKLCHVKILIDNLGNLSNLQEDSFFLSGDVYYRCDRDFYLFREIKFDDTVKLINPNPEMVSSITYTFENLHLINGGTVLKIDVYVSSSEPTSFEEGLVEIRFNDAALSLQSGSPGFGFERGEVISVQTVYTVSTQSFGTDELQVFIQTPDDDNLFLIDNNPYKLMSITLDVVDCNQLTGLEFISSLMDEKSFHFVSGIFPYEMYDPVISSDVSNTNVCTCTDEPDMQSFSPVEIHAGMREVLTITGTDFGTYNPATCSVTFENGDTGGGFLDPAVAEEADIISWSDTEIKLFVPSTSSGEAFKKPACSGQIKVTNDCGDDDDAEINIAAGNPELHIPYAVLNRRTSPQKVADMVTLSNDIAGNGYMFYYANNLPNLMKDAFSEALEDWCIETEPNFRISNQVPVDPMGNNIVEATLGDGYNTVTFEDIGVAPGDAALVVGGSYFTPCVNASTGRITWVLEELDIKIDEDIDLDFDRIKNAMLHELGHAQMLQHSKNPNAINANGQYIMFHTSFGVDMGTIKQDDKTGALELYPNSSFALSEDINCNIPFEQSANCGDMINSVSQIEHSEYLSIIPNPNHGNFLVTFDGSEVNYSLEWEIQNVSGKTLAQGTSTTKKFNVNVEGLPQGAYIFSMTMEDRKTSKKIIIL